MPMQNTQTGWRLLILLLIAVNVIPEAILQMAEAGWIGAAHWRLTAYGYGALWKGLLAGWQPNFTGQPALMFLSYGFLHAGFLHLAGNIIGILWLAPLTARQVGAAGLALIYAISVLGGGLVFVLLSDSIRPMVGASGAVYGLATAWIYWDYRERRQQRLPLGIIWAKLLTVCLCNLIGWWIAAGEMAWQTHLGGMIAAWCCARALRRPQDSEPPASQP